MITKEYTETIQYVNYDSSTVRSTEYNYLTNVLTVFFDNNIYNYTGVSQSDYEAFRDSDSQGKSLNQIIKGKYEYKKIKDLL